MARRSARLRKRSPTPSDASSASNWETAKSAASPPPERLPSLSETKEPVSTPAGMKTPRKPVAATQPASQLPQPSNSATPLKKQSSISAMLTAMTARTPENRTPIKPAGEEMHPAHHHASTAKVLDEARWLGFQALGAYTAPPKASDGTGLGHATPSKTPASNSKGKFSSMIQSSPDFKFRFKSPFAGLSPQSSRILKNEKDEHNVVGDRPLFGADEFSSPADVPPRKFAVPKGKATRFSDVHKSQFQKMDSIANHPSAFRADPSRFKPAHPKLQRPQPQVEPQAPATPKASLKRTQSKMDLNESPKRLAPTPLKRTQSKMDVTQPSSSLPRPQSTVRMVQPSGTRPPTQDGPGAKRVKRHEADDAASTRPVSRDGQTEPKKPMTPARRTGLPRLKSRLMTPTAASIARSQSVKAPKTTTSMLPPLVPSPSMRSLFSPTNIGVTMREGVREGIRKTSNSLHKVKSILRTPARKFSEDPEKIAAGTHMSPPPGLDLGRALGPALPQGAATAPVRKHVNFTTSTLERIAQDELGRSPSPIKFRAGSEAPVGAVLYPVLQSGVDYPSLPTSDESPSASPSRRLTFNGTGAETPNQFLFKSDKPIKFGPSSAGTIRMVRKSDASSLNEGKKRKLDVVEESSDKENSKADDDGRSAKKMKAAPVQPPMTPLRKQAQLKQPSDYILFALYKVQRFLQDQGVAEFFTNPRFSDPAYLTTLSIVLASVFVAMSWFSRTGGNWGGRFSPFSRPGSNPDNTQVDDRDFSYITKDDLETHLRSPATAEPEIVEWADSNPDRDTDVVIFKHGRTNYPMHFSVHSIQDGSLRVGAVRAAAAKKIGVSDARRIRMFYKGRNLKHDDRTAREEGLRGDGSGSEILCVVGEAGAGAMAPGSEDSGMPGMAHHSWSEGEDEDDTEDVSDNPLTAGGKKKPRKRSGKKNKKKRGTGTGTGNDLGTASPKGYTTQGAGAEFLPIPAHINPAPRPSSAPPPSSGAATPLSAHGKLDAIASKFHVEFVPLCVQFMANPPEEKAKRDFEYKKLSETILTQIIFKLDSVETEGDPEARQKRKDLVREVQGMLTKLDQLHNS
ncbi:hypothetical protein P154DRAFT_432328 [Amniculicola lignicola CBS 123094]|uniref:BAG domain-containing protein n=1 Tax=Amniculicola lignicola CBS 123094 TaxID=1392246 RepID=A0A6A5WRM0_9PLEO|nr:hypothetical protein P154DRAFT_432328 [Amniculicola lignicola CBS 123094]